MDIQHARDDLAKLLATRTELAHLQVRKHGKSLIVHSGSGADEQKHARLTHIAGPNWALSFPHHTGRWDKTPFTGSTTDLIETLVTDFPFFLEQY
jgi:hypothetical protein